MIAWNRAIENLTGIKAREMLGKGDYEYAIPFYGERRPVLIDIIGQWDKEIEKKYQYITKEGESLVSETYDSLVKPGGFLWNKASVLYDHNGEVIGAIESIRDITDYRQAQAALKESEDKFKLISEQSLLGIGIIQDGRIKYANETHSKMTGYALAESYGWEPYGYARTVYKDDLPFVMEQSRKKQAGDKDVVTNYQFRGFTKAKEIVWWDLYSRTITYHGKFADLFTMVDITERVKSEKDRQALETQLQQAQKMEAIGTLAGGIAHDFNNILGGIMGYSELAKMTAPEGSSVIAYLDKLIKSSNRAADLVKQILTISRRHKQEQRPVQVRYIVREALNLLKATLPTTIQIREDLPKDSGVVNADPTQMHQVIMNLGANAGHAMQKDGGVLDVSLANVALDDLSVSRHLDLAAGSYLRLTVGDTGHGMSAEIMERIFDPYFTTKDTGEGTGLGLAVAHGIVKAHGGAITVYSELGNGTTFHVYLPIIQEAEKLENAPEASLPTGSERILFVDDEDVLIEIGSRMLEVLGYEVVTQKSSVQALELFRAESDRFDLVITDMTMPHLTGDKLARELMEIRPKIPIILCTGHTRLISEENAREMGVKAFVMKPLVMRNLAETVRKALGD